MHVVIDTSLEECPNIKRSMPTPAPRLLLASSSPSSPSSLCATNTLRVNVRVKQSRTLIVTAAIHATSGVTINLQMLLCGILLSHAGPEELERFANNDPTRWPDKAREGCAHIHAMGVSDQFNYLGNHPFRMVPCTFSFRLLWIYIHIEIIRAFLE